MDQLQRIQFDTRERSPQAVAEELLRSCGGDEGKARQVLRSQAAARL
jgi:hypothetical protein